MNVKATHRGHCQVCNRVQKVPNKLMAKHGYAVLAGYFEGVCYGSGHFPLELSKTMVIRSIAVTEDRIKEFEHAVQLWSVPATEPKAWFFEYVLSKSRYIPSGYHWRIVELQREEKTFQDNYKYNEDTFIGYDGKKESLRKYGINGDTLLNIADQLNKKYVDLYLRKGIADMQSYIKNQRHRIEVWHERPLIPIK